MQGVGGTGSLEEVFGVQMRYSFASAWSYGPDQAEPRGFSVVIDTAGMSEDEALTWAEYTVIEWFHAERRFAKKSEGVKGARRPENVTWLVFMGAEPVGEEIAA